MTVLRAPIFRFLATIMLTALLVASARSAYSIASAAVRQDNKDAERYAGAPNCFPDNKSIRTGSRLPPCQDSVDTIVAKSPKESEGLLTLRDDDGKTEIVGPISSDVWRTIHAGDRISVQRWQGKVRKVTARGASDWIVNDRNLNTGSGSVAGWIAIAFVCVGIIAFAWRPGQP